MSDISYRTAAALSATLQVMGARLGKRLDDKGQASAEYVGILVFVAFVVAAIIALNSSVSSTLQGLIEGALAKIKN